jgi:hypothetical protein
VAGAPPRLRRSPHRLLHRASTRLRASTSLTLRTERRMAS